MTTIIDSVFRNKEVNFLKLATYGFIKESNDFILRKKLAESGFALSVIVDADGKVSAQITDPAFNEVYTLHLIDGAEGGFVGKIRTDYEYILTEIADKCFEPAVFKTDCAKFLIQYVRDIYGDELEFLWDRFPYNAVWRRKETAKWYGALLTVSKRKLGDDSDERIEIIDLRVKPEELIALIDGKKYYPGYHMNKKHWCTVILDGSVSTDELICRLKNSYDLAVK